MIKIFFDSGGKANGTDEIWKYLVKTMKNQRSVKMLVLFYYKKLDFGQFCSPTETIVS